MLLFEQCTPPGVPNNDWSPFLAFVPLGHVWNFVHLDEDVRFVQKVVVSLTLAFQPYCVYCVNM